MYPSTPDLDRLLRELRASSAGRTQVLPRLTGWERGDAARILRGFCIGIGIPSVKFHALRACFATHLLRSGIAPAVVMKICGWTELKTMQHYIRLAGIEIDGATDALPITLPEDAANKVVELFSQGGTTA